jgi:hypothetical protein
VTEAETEGSLRDLSRNHDTSLSPHLPRPGAILVLRLALDLRRARDISCASLCLLASTVKETDNVK